MIGDGKHASVKRGSILLSRYYSKLTLLYSDYGDKESFEREIKAHEEFLKRLQVPIMLYVQSVEKSIMCGTQMWEAQQNEGTPSGEEAIVKILQSFDQANQCVSSYALLGMINFPISVDAKETYKLIKSAYQRRLGDLRVKSTDNPDASALIKLCFLLLASKA